ncbi:hypothetical protein FOMPIDRAFT_65224, partial [Fomitopsis schrenkii]
GHPDRSSSSSNPFELGSSSLENLDDAVILHLEAHNIYPVGHPDRSSSLKSLATAPQTRFEQLIDCVDLDSAVTLRREASNPPPC